MSDYKYQDIDLSFSKHPVTDDLDVKNDEEAIKQSLRNLILTHFYEKPFHPEIGSQIYGLLFETNTPTTKLYIKEAIERVINNYEPRVFLEKVTVSDAEDYTYKIHIMFKILNIQEATSIDFFLNRVR